MSARAAVSYLADRGVTGDLIFMDPPYAEGDASLALIEAIWDKKILKSDGFIMMEHEKSVIMPLCIKGYQRLKEKKYGITVISYYSGE
ncbi:MAG: RsmD family RNA methyltransferase [Eubacteriaceae bacterium]|nr:RsmD family RNA methyltransferase [Eubacteriaceae bacterium]